MSTAVTHGQTLMTTDETGSCNTWPTCRPVCHGHNLYHKTTVWHNIKCNDNFSSRSAILLSWREKTASCRSKTSGSFHSKATIVINSNQAYSVFSRVQIRRRLFCARYRPSWPHCSRWGYGAIKTVSFSVSVTKLVLTPTPNLNDPLCQNFTAKWHEHFTNTGNGYTN